MRTQSYPGVVDYIVPQSQKAASAYFTSEQILPVVFAGEYEIPDVKWQSWNKNRTTE